MSKSTQEPPSPQGGVFDSISNQGNRKINAKVQRHMVELKNFVSQRLSV